ncbi:MAG: hypothetical protein KJZ92_14880 [Rhodocyclaceae bacterium]|jgi:hypothetical protein|nr:hypothetical protein [Rhodocyclaceae bacterium]MCL4682540.1 hypothetical protein [Rhodocyclaceae bacterium]
MTPSSPAGQGDIALAWFRAAEIHLLLAVAVAIFSFNIFSARTERAAKPEIAWNRES